MEFFLSFCLKKNKILRVHVKDKSCNSLQDFKPATFFCEYFKGFSNSFFMKQLQSLLLNYVLVSERIFKKKVSREIAFELISLFHVQIQEPKSMSTTTRAFAFLAKFLEFYYHKIFETRRRWRPKPLRG